MGATDLWKTRWPSVGLIVADAAGFAGAWWLAWELRRWLGDLEATKPINEWAPYAQVWPVVTALGLANCLAFGLYVQRRRLSSLTQWRRMIQVGYHYLLYLMVVGYFWKELDLGRSVILLAGGLAFGYVWASRTAFRRLKLAALEAGRGRVTAAIVGSGPLAAEVHDSLLGHRDIGYEVVGYFVHGDEPVVPQLGDIPRLGGTGDLKDALARGGIEELFLALPHLPQGEQLNLVDAAASPGLRVHLVADMFGVITRDANVDEIGSLPVITLRGGFLPWHQAAAKRTLDIVASAVGVAAWLLFFHWWIVLRIRAESPGPVFFVHERVGRDGRPFRMYKYRTMHAASNPYAVAPTSEGDARITPFGRWLRRTSLDELPQLLNVLRGEMSMVGPRPEMPFIVAGYEPWQRRRLDVKPGITGLWQVIGRKNLPLHLNMEYDFYYIKNQSLLLDLEILIRTVPAVIKGRGAF